MGTADFLFWFVTIIYSILYTAYDYRKLAWIWQSQLLFPQREMTSTPEPFLCVNRYPPEVMKVFAQNMPDAWNGICMASARTTFSQHLHNSRGKQLRHHQVLHFDALISIKIPSDTEKSASKKGDKQSFQVTKISGIILESHICCYLPVLRCSHRVRAHLLAAEGIWARAPWTPKSWIKQEWNQRSSCSCMYV